MIPVVSATLSLSLFQLLSPSHMIPGQEALASHTISLSHRYENGMVNEVFSDNILLTLAYLHHMKINPEKVDWDAVHNIKTIGFSLNPKETFSFHDDVLPDYTMSVTTNTGAHFSSSEGFRSDGYLSGDGVCHLASLMNWVARDAHLEVVAPTSHDFAMIPEIPPMYGTSIYTSNTKGSENDEMQNLYITNTKDHQISFVFEHVDNTLTLEVRESSSPL